MISLTAPAKLTLSLGIIGVRGDGYHEIEAEMVTIDLCDRIEIEPDGAGLRIFWPDPAATVDAGGDAGVVASAVGAGAGVSAGAGVGAAAGTQSGAANPRRLDPAGSSNLVTRALELAGRRAGVTVHKSIPVGAGLGGGSADAAAILRWAGFDDTAAAVAGVGCDVGFCLQGGRARVRGIGEVVEPRPYLRQQYTLLISPLQCSTAKIYAAWDAMGGPRGAAGNDLEAAALAAVPELARWRDELGSATQLTPRLAGSGSTWFVAGAHPGANRLVVTTTPR